MLYKVVCLNRVPGEYNFVIILFAEHRAPTLLGCVGSLRWPSAATTSYLTNKGSSGCDPAFRRPYGAITQGLSGLLGRCVTPGSRRAYLRLPVDIRKGDSGPQLSGGLQPSAGNTSAKPAFRPRASTYSRSGECVRACHGWYGRVAH
jgi:hypothetical protein